MQEQIKNISWMIEIIKDLPASIVGFMATGKVTKDDYETVLFPQLGRYLQTAHRIDYLFVMDTSPENFTIGAWLEDVWLRIKEISKWRRVAIVTNAGNFRRLTETVGHLFPGEYKGFNRHELDKAVQWLASSPNSTF
jgi:hypothetical protein